MAQSNVFSPLFGVTAESLRPVLADAGLVIAPLNVGAAELIALMERGQPVVLQNGTADITLTTSAQALSFLYRAHMLSAADGDEVVVNLPAMDATCTQTLLGTTRNITIRGAAYTSTTLSTPFAAITSSAAGNHRVDLTVADATGAVVGGFLVVTSITDGSGRGRNLLGCHEITAVSGNTVTIKHKHRMSAIPSLAGVSAGSVRFMSTILRFEGRTGIDISGYYGGLYQRMVVAGDGAGSNVYGVKVYDGASLRCGCSTSQTFAAVNFAEHGFYAIQRATLEAFDTYATGNTGSGYLIGNESHATLTRAVATGNNSNGISVSSQSVLTATSGSALGNGGNGYNGNGPSHLVAQSTFSYDNVGSGYYGSERTYVDATSGNAQGNQYGVRANNSEINITSATVSNNTTADQRRENNGRLVLTSTTASYQLLADSIYALKVTVADDAATSFLVDAANSRNLGWQVFANNSGFKGSGHCQVTASVFCTLDADSVGTAATTGVLSGTTGADGVITVSVHTDGRFYIENRSGASRSITLVFTGQSTS